MNWEEYGDPFTPSYEYVEKQTLPFLSEDYDRIFPSKLVLILLANRILESGKDGWIDYEDFRKTVFEKIQKFAIHLKTKNPTHNKNKKITVGLTFIEPDDPRFSKIRENNAKNEFLEKYVGSTTRAYGQTRDYPPDSYDKAYGYMRGILIDLKLVVFKLEPVNNKEKRFSISLSKQGLDFLKKENPILDKNNFDKSLSEDEGQFYKNELLKHLNLENSEIGRAHV